MRVFLKISVMLFVLNAPVIARLGDTLDQAEARYGLPKKKPLTGKIEPVLLEGAKELWFQHEGFWIRCAFLPAKDNREYVVKEEYRRKWDAAAMKNGQPPEILETERDAILKAEAGRRTWQQKSASESDNSRIKAATKKAVDAVGLEGGMWVRDDGATAQLSTASLKMVLELPQAAKWASEWKALNQSKPKAAPPSF